MGALYSRDGAEWTGAVHDASGRPYGLVRDACHRCGSARRFEHWRHIEGGICFRCSGDGREPADRTVKLYTAERLAKLVASAERKSAKLAAKAAAERADRDAKAAERRDGFERANGDLLAWLRGAGAGRDGAAYADGFLGEMLRRADTEAAWSDGQAEALAKWHARAIADADRARHSGHVGEIGERRSFVATVEREAQYQRVAFKRSWSGDGMETVYITTLRDERGNALVVRSPAWRAPVGDRIAFKATVKEHSEFRGERQTMLARVATVAEVPAKPAG